MKRVLAALAVLSSLLVNAPARAEVNAVTMLIVNHTYLQGDKTLYASDPNLCVPTPTGPPTCVGITKLYMPKGGGVTINNMDLAGVAGTTPHALDSCAANDRVNCHTLTADLTVNNGGVIEPIFESATKTVPGCTSCSWPYIPPGVSGNLDINAPLTVNTVYAFHCRVHAAMHGYVKITAA